MKNLKCLLGHNLRIMKLKDCRKEFFENDDKGIVVYWCKYCNRAVYTHEKYRKAHFDDAFKGVNSTD